MNLARSDFALLKGLISVFALLLSWATIAIAQPPAPLTSLAAIHALTHVEAAKEPPAVFEATVTYLRPSVTTLFVQEGNAAIYVATKESSKLSYGDRVLVRGKVADSFRPVVIADTITILSHHAAVPTPVRATFEQLIRSQFDCMRVTIRARVYSADLVTRGNAVQTRLRLLMDGGVIDTFVNNADRKFLDGLLDSQVDVTGIAGAWFDGKMQQVGVALSVASTADVKVINVPKANPWTLPLTQMNGIIDKYHVKTLSQRVHVRGTITYYQPGYALALQSGNKSLWVATTFEEPLRVGELVDVTGFPDVPDGFLTLAAGEVEKATRYAPLVPESATRSQLAASKHIFDLVSIEGQVVMEVRESSQDEYVLLSDGQLFSAIYRHPNDAAPPPMKQVPLGSRISVAGICILSSSNPWSGEVPFNILMRTPDDILVLAQPSWLTVRNLALLVGFLLFVVFVVVARGWIIERRVRRQTTAAANIEYRRGHILEDINGSRPLAEIVEQITELVSFQLDGAPCWCQIADGAQLGQWPSPLSNLRIEQHAIPARAGASLGTIFAALGPLSKVSTIESEALAMAAGLATLAIENRRLYSDLLRRSEFDLLTDIHNRFSLDKQLEARIEAARNDAAIFGLIYIDLDRFKVINDLYGHQTGDLYLQEVARRMKRQLRPADILARLGGDEFAALIPIAPNRAGVEDIATRLDLCFDEPFAINGQILQGSASMGIALYPEDGETKDRLLSSADAAMYVAKNMKRDTQPRHSVLHMHQ